MILYHGTNVPFEEIDLKKSRLGKDFGVGFYLTPDKTVAERQAARKLLQFGVGFANVISYEWNELSCEGLSIKRYDGYSIEWAEFVLENRKNRTMNQVHSYDIVIGPIADDTIGFQIRRFEDGIITLEQFLKEIQYHTVTIQYLFATEKSLKSLIRL